ncbi:NnrU family protein [Parasphingorhabdus halotolerans]|uniref:NnrU family protein n=1 Tax=Parasphingorhabdus halotolerans TaxID=2725558 RepID=A0A6H2DPF2_9SPHN|nr:NnrU family protein [Parasphingorhabdus halotolerans]QJB70017.1 NnrU family protein [Parasphingorhabdus halotolerans]
MGMLIAGVLLWSIVHLMKSVTPGVRAGIVTKLGAGPHQGLVALLIVTSLALMIFGWRSIVPEFVYDPPSWGRHLNMLLMILAIYLFGVAQGKSRIKQWLRHPMLTGMAIWAGGHLLANGDNRSLVLFGGLLVWALVSIITVSRNEGAWQKPTVFPSAGREILSVVIALILYGVLFGAHRWIAGVPLVGG